jgi:S-adenosylmethionine hydrolase
MKLIRSHFNPTILFLLILVIPLVSRAQVIVLQSDFGTRDSAVTAMKLVILGVDPKIQILDNTHDIEPFKIYEGAYRLYQSAPFAAPGTVYVSVVDPGVGSNRLSVVAKDSRGVYYVTPDNGTLSFIEKEVGISEVRVIDESKLRRPGSENSHTFHGRDIYAYVGGLLASQKIAFSEVGTSLDPSALERFEIPNAQISNDKLILSGLVEIHDIRYGNVWTNIPEDLVREFGVKENATVTIRILNDGKLYKRFQLPFLRSFAAAKKHQGGKLIYMNSLGKLACSKLLGNLAKSERIGFGPRWTVEITK